MKRLHCAYSNARLEETWTTHHALTRCRLKKELTRSPLNAADLYVHIANALAFQKRKDEAAYYYREALKCVLDAVSLYECCFLGLMVAEDLLLLTNMVTG